jgi:phenylacetate-CoA ligase
MHIFPKPNLQNFRKLFYFIQLKRHQWLKESDLIRIQEKRLKGLINHAYHNVPFYNELFDSVGVKPQDVQTVKDLQKIPILTKENVKDNYPGKIVAKGIDITKCHTRSTTGSTGMPLRILFGPKEIDYYASLNLFVWFTQGLRIKDKHNTIFHEFQYETNKLFEKLRIFNWENISIFDPVEEIIKSLKNSKPDVIFSYPSMLLLLSQEIEKRNLRGINPRLIRTGGESLTKDIRNKVSNAFNCDVYAQYASEEFGVMTFECNAHSGYHVISDAVIIEIVNEDGHVVEGEEGEIVVTGLFNYTMPLIRYKLGDIGTLTHEKCACGRQLPLIKSIEGRTDDFLVLPSGKKVSPRVINVIEGIPGVSRYKTVQEAKDRIVVNLVKGKGFGQETLKEIEKRIKAGCLAEDVEVDVKLVEDLPLERRGKLRAVISNVKD